MNEFSQSKKKDSREEEKRMINILQSGNSSAILSTIKEIRSHGRLSVLPEVFNLLQNADDHEILGACIDLINDLKMQESAPYVIQAIKDNSLKDIRHHLVSSCWQNGLDYSQHINLFADLLIKADYLVAVEAFTVLENHLGSIEDAELLKITDKLKTAQTKAPKDKKSLIEEMLNTIRDY